MITICLVAYSKKYLDTLAYQSLMNLSAEIQQQINLIVFDNGEVAYQTINHNYQLNQFVYYFNDKSERGTRIAYQYAFENTDDQWLLLLDDDTKLTEKYLKLILREIQFKRQDIVAFTPIIKSEEGIQISPTQSNSLQSLNFPLKAGDYSKNITGISSGLVLNTDFLDSIDGFNAPFVLDYLDHWLFYKIISEGRKVSVIDVEMIHHLSVMDLKTISKTRYQSIFESEYQFYRTFRPSLLNSLKFNYMKRIVKGLFLRQKQFHWRILLGILLRNMS